MTETTKLPTDQAEAFVVFSPKYKMYRAAGHSPITADLTKARLYKTRAKAQKEVDEERRTCPHDSDSVVRRVKIMTLD